MKVETDGAGMSVEPGKLFEELTTRLRGRLSLRAGITLAITLITVLAVLATGLLAFVRNSTTQIFLGDQFQNSVKEKAEGQIQALASQEAQSIKQFFNDVDRAVAFTADTAGNLLDQTATFEDGAYWDATQKLFQLPSGAWDNSNEDSAAIFAPSDIEITEQNRSELNAIIQLDLIVPDTLEANPDIVAMYYISSNDLTVYYPNIDLANLVPSNFKATTEPFFTNAASINQRNNAWTLPYQDPALTGLIVTNSGPVFDENYKLRGVIGADVQLSKIEERVETLRIGTTGYAILIDSFGHIIAMPDLGYQDFDLTQEEIPVNEVPKLTILDQGPDELRFIFQSMAQGGTGLTRAQIHGIEHYIVYAPISSTKYSLGIIVPVSEMDTAYREAQTLAAQENQATRNYVIILLAIVIVASALVSLGISQFLTNPVKLLTNTAQQVSSGDLSVKVPETSINELNVLARTFNAMTSQLKETLSGLEERVSKRTSELELANEQIQRRAALFEAISQVTRSISTSQDLEILLPTITNVISQQFGYYHVGIFLLDNNEEFAVLRASNSSGGQKMLARKHQLKVGETGIVGYVTNTGEARIALDTGADAVFFDNPDLPDTRSEMALPLIIGNQVIGALDVQSVEPNAFSHEDVATLSTLADQVSIAIQNSHLYEETHKALAQLQTLVQRFTQEGWSQFTHSQNLSGIRRSESTATLLKEPLSLEAIKNDGYLDLPINLRGQKIGTLKMRTSDGHQWTQDEIDIASAIIERAAIAMENARLVADAQRRATRERVIGDISASISTFSDMEGILRTAVQQLGRRLGGAEVELELGTEARLEEEAFSDLT